MSSFDAIKSIVGAGGDVRFDKYSIFLMSSKKICVMKYDKLQNIDQEKVFKKDELGKAVNLFLEWSGVESNLA